MSKFLPVLGIAVLLVLWWNMRSQDNTDLPDIREEHIDVFTAPTTPTSPPTYNQRAAPEQDSGSSSVPNNNSGYSDYEESGTFRETPPKAVSTMQFAPSQQDDPDSPQPTPAENSYQDNESSYPDSPADAEQNGNLTSDIQEPAEGTINDNNSERYGTPPEREKPPPISDTYENDSAERDE